MNSTHILLTFANVTTTVTILKQYMKAGCQRGVLVYAGHPWSKQNSEHDCYKENVYKIKGAQVQMRSYSWIIVQFAWYSCEISVTEQMTRIIRANACCECSRSHQLERTGENYCKNIRANNSRQCKSTLTV